MNEFERPPGESAVLVCSEAVVHLRKQMRVRPFEGLVVTPCEQGRDLLENGLEADVLREIPVEVAAPFQKVRVCVGALEFNEFGHAWVVVNDA